MTLPKKDLISIRDSLPDDKNFIFSTWLKGVYYGNDWFQEIDQDSYFRNYQKIIEKILARPDVRIQVACLRDDPGVVLGYSVLEGDILHYVFCKEVWRGIGLSNDLVPKNIKIVTHLTKPGRAILRAKYPNAIFNPFM